MSTEDNENEPVSLADDVPSEVEQEEPIEQVMSQEPTYTGAAEPSEPAIEEEDKEQFEETAKFEEEIEHKPSDSRRRRSTKKVTEPDSKLISNLQGELKRYSDAGKKTDLTLRDIQRRIKELDKKTDIKHHQIVRELQTQVKELQRKIDRIERSTKTTKTATSIRKTAKTQKGKSKKSAKAKTRRR